MSDLRICTKAGLGFAVVAGLSASVALGEGSELPDGSVTIGALPFADTGDTSDNFHDFDAVCPWASLSPDVFYAYTSDGSSSGISVTLCESGYDTKAFILDSAFNEIACNDDFCTSSGGGGFRSTIECAAVASGSTVHIAVDGWSGAAGVYDLIVDGCEPAPECIFGAEDCPAGSVIEGEVCVEDVEDTTNGGCNSSPTPLFTSVACGDTVCGQIYQGAVLRDTDWYALTSAGDSDVTMAGAGEFDIVFGRIDDSGCVPGAPDCGCIGTTIDPFVTAAPCVDSSVTSSVVAGDSWWFVSTVAAGAVPCGGELPGNDYVVSFTCAAATCCTLGDANEDAFVDFNDLVILLANWGPCGG